MVKVLYAPKLTPHFIPAAAASSRVKILITFVHFPQNGTVSATSVDRELVAWASALKAYDLLLEIKAELSEILMRERQ